MSDDFLKGFKAGFEAALEATSAQKARREEKIEYLLAEKQKAKEWAIGKGFLKAAIGIPMPANNEFVLSEKLKAKQWASDQGYVTKKNCECNRKYSNRCCSA